MDETREPRVFGSTAGPNVLSVCGSRWWNNSPRYRSRFDDSMSQRRVFLHWHQQVGGAN